MGVALSVAALPATALASAAPTIEHFSASHITQNDATVEAQVNPEGLETTYEVFMPEYPCRFSECIVLHLGLGGGSIPATATDQSISIDLASKHAQLEGGEQYGVAIIAKNSAGTVEEHYSFRAFPKNAAPPSIESESASNVAEHGATLEAQIDTNDLYTGYWFQIDTNSSYDFTRPNCPFEGLSGGCESISVGEPLPPGLVEPQPEYIPAASGDRSVSLDLASIGATLQPDTTYYYRVIASSGGPTVDGPDQTFTTPSQPTSPPGQDSEPSSPSGGGGPLASELPGAFPATVATVNPSGLPSVDKPKASTNAQKLAKALKVCAKKPKNQRASCKKQAEKKYATTNKKKP